MPRLLVIGFIWLGCSASWWILGASLTRRSVDSTVERGAEVHELWGAPLQDGPPTASYSTVTMESRTKTVQREGEEPVTTTTEHQIVRDYIVPVESSDVRADFSLDHRMRGLMWFATYVVDFEGTYAFRNPSNEPQDMDIQLTLDTVSRTYDGLLVTDLKGVPIPFRIVGSVAKWELPFEGGQERRVRVAFRTRGTGTWSYTAAADGGEARDFNLAVTTNFPDVDFPVDSVSPTQHMRTDRGWEGAWQFESLITSSPLAIKMPERLNPGPLAARITFFAPVSLLFFFFVIAILSIKADRQMHPMHYFLLGCSFFAFHLLFAYSVDHLALAWSFVLSAIVSLFLVVTYVRLFVGWRFALRTVAPAQLLYLVLFSASFFWQGFTGLAITVGAIMTLFVVMQLTGRLDWEATFARRGGEPASLSA